MIVKQKPDFDHKAIMRNMNFTVALQHLLYLVILCLLLFPTSFCIFILFAILLFVQFHGI